MEKLDIIIALLAMILGGQVMLTIMTSYFSGKVYGSIDALKDRIDIVLNQQPKD
jgi:hypothetical protein